MGNVPDYVADVKNMLDITWDDKETDEKLFGICRRAESFLSKRAGKQLRFSVGMKDQALLQLLYDCIRYIWNNVLGEFEKNYSDDLLMLRMNVQAEEMDYERCANV